MCFKKAWQSPGNLLLGLAENPDKYFKTSVNNTRRQFWCKETRKYSYVSGLTKQKVFFRTMPPIEDVTNSVINLDDIGSVADR